MNNINHSKMPPEVVKERFADARRHLKFATYMHKLQTQGGGDMFYTNIPRALRHGTNSA